MVKWSKISIQVEIKTKQEDEQKYQFTLKCNLKSKACQFHDLNVERLIYNHETTFCGISDS